MGIDFSKFAKDIQTKIKSALSDNKIDAEEVRAMNLEKDVAIKLMQELSGNPDIVGDGFIKGGSKNKKLILLDKPENGSTIPLTQDSLSYYKNINPLVEQGIYQDGMIYLADKNGNLVKDKNNNYISEKVFFEKTPAKLSFLNSDNSINVEKFQAYLNELPDSSEDYQTLMKDIADSSKEQSYWSINKFAKDQKERFIKVYNAIDNHDLGLAVELMYSFFQEECQGFDENVLSKIKGGLERLTGAKWAGPALYNVLSFVSEHVDDLTGRDENGIGSTQRLLVGIDNAGEGLGDFVFSSEGLFTMGAIAGGEALLAKASSTLAPYVGAAIHSYFGAEGVNMVGEGSYKVLTGSTLEEVAEGGQEIGHGLPLALPIVTNSAKIYKQIKASNAVNLSITKSMKDFEASLKFYGVSYEVLADNRGTAYIRIVSDYKYDPIKGMTDIKYDLYRFDKNEQIVLKEDVAEKDMNLKRQKIVDNSSIDNSGNLNSSLIPLTSKKTKYEFQKIDYKNDDVFDLIDDAKGTEAVLFEKGEKQLRSLVDKLKKGERTSEPVVISEGINHFGIMIDKTQGDKTVVTVRNWLGNKESFDKPALKEQVFTFELDDEGVMTSGKVYWSNYYESYDKTEYSYTFNRKSNDQGSIVFRQDYYHDKYAYKTKAKPEKSESETYVPSQDNPDAWVYASENGDPIITDSWDFTLSRNMQEAESAIEYKEGRNDLLNMFLNFARKDVSLKPEAKVTETKTNETLTRGKTVEPWPDNAEYLHNENPQYNKTIIELKREAKASEQELFAKAEEAIPKLIEQLPDGKKMFMPHTITIGNNSIGIIVDKTKSGRTDVIIKNWQGDKKGWNYSALGEELLQYQLDSDGNIIVANVRWNDYFEENDIIRNYYTFTYDNGGSPIIKSQKKYYLDKFRYQRNNKEPFWKKQETFRISQTAENSWVCAEHDGSVPMEKFIEENPENSSIMNMFLRLAKKQEKVEQINNSTQNSQVEVPAIETPKAEQPKESSAASPLTGLKTPQQKSSTRKISAEKAEIILAQVKDKVKENLKQYIGIEIYKNSVVSFKDSPKEFDKYIDYQARKIIHNYESVLPETRAFIKEAMKEIVLERIKNIDVKNKIANEGLRQVEQELNHEFADITSAGSKTTSLKVKNLFSDKSTLEVFVKEGLNIGEIATLISADAHTASKMLKIHDFDIDGRRKKRIQENPQEESPSQSDEVSGGEKEEVPAATGKEDNPSPSVRKAQEENPVAINLYTLKSVEELQTEIMSLSNTPEVSGNRVFEELSDFIFEQSEYTPEQKILIGEFIDIIKDIKEGNARIDDTKKLSTISKLNKWKEFVAREEAKFEQNFNNTQNKLDKLAQRFNKHQMDDVFRICSKYLSNDIKNAEVYKNANEILDICQKNNGNLMKTAEAIRDWDFGKDPEIRAEAEKYAADEKGEINADKVNEYIHFARILYSPDTATPIGKFAEVLSAEKNMPISLGVKNLVKINDILNKSVDLQNEIIKELNENIKKRNELIEEENKKTEKKNEKLRRKGMKPLEMQKKEALISNTEEPHPELILPELYDAFSSDTKLDKSIMEMYFNNYYKDKTSAAVTKDPKSKNDAKKQLSYITPEAKEGIMSKYGYPNCLNQFYKYEKSLRYFSPPKGQSGVKTNMDKNNNKMEYTMEVKILGTGCDDRLVSSKNNFVFDIWIPDGFH